MIRHTLIITVIDALYRLTVDADRMAWMRQGAAERIPPLSLLRKAFTAGSHGTTFGGHPVSCAAALAEVNELLDRDLAGNAKKVGDYFTAKLEKLPHVKEVRHQGLLVGVEFDDTISGVDVKHGCFDRHMLITAIGSHIIRMVPPLIVSEEECDKAFDIIKETVESLS